MSDSRWAAVLFAAAFLARLVAMMGSAIFGTDSCHYLLMADWMRAGRFHDALTVAYHPMYPLLISLARAVFPSTEQAGNTISVLLGAAAVVPLFLTVRAVFGRPTAVLTALLYAFSPALVEVQSDVMTEGTFIFFLFSSMWLTWWMKEGPSLDRGVVLGAAAACAFLTRPEGLLAVALAVLLPLGDAIVRRKEVLKWLGPIALTAAVMALLMAPYLLWVRSERGAWALSARPSVVHVQQGSRPDDDGATSGSAGDRTRRYRLYGASLFRLSLHGVLVPFFIVGLASLRQFPFRDLAFFLSYPVGQLGGVAFALRSTTFMSDRYLLAGMALLSAVAALGMVAAMRSAARKWPESRFRPALCGAVILILIVLPAARAFKVRRTELLSSPVAAQWILAHGPRPTAMTGVEQVAYYCGSRSYYSPASREEMTEFLRKQPMNYVVHSDKDVQKRPEYVAMLRSLDRLEPPVEVQGPPGTWKVYIQRVK